MACTGNRAHGSKSVTRGLDSRKADTVLYRAPVFPCEGAYTCSAADDTFYNKIANLSSFTDMCKETCTIGLVIDVHCQRMAITIESALIIIFVCSAIHES